jgi:glycerol-3-phosphate acyltransferase PlsY
MNLLPSLIAVILSYLAGSVPFGLLFAWLFSNVDVRNVGSGNIGATNVLRASGKKAAVLTLLADCLKGFGPVLAVQLFFRDDVLTAVCGAAAVFGHNFPVFLRFKGGKGVATGYGVILAIDPLVGFICLILWLVAAVIWRYSSLAALISFACFPVLLIGITSQPRPFVILSLFLFGMIYYRHRENIKRLLSGTEPRIGTK